jgi:hypothetical protein
MFWRGSLYHPSSLPNPRHCLPQPSCIMGGSNDGGINCFPVPIYPLKQCGKGNLPLDPTNACVLDVNSVSLMINGIDVCLLHVSPFLMLRTFQPSFRFRNDMRDRQGELFCGTGGLSHRSETSHGPRNAPGFHGCHPSRARGALQGLRSCHYSHPEQGSHLLQ